MRIIAVIAIAAIAFIAGSFTQWAIDTPYCPTEDSCTIDYHDGTWFIEPTIP